MIKQTENSQTHNFNSLFTFKFYFYFSGIGEMYINSFVMDKLGDFSRWRRKVQKNLLYLAQFVCLCKDLHLY